MDALSVQLFDLKKYEQKEIANWESDLTQNMMIYASYDAYLSLIIFFGLINYNTPIIVPNTTIEVASNPGNVQNLDKYESESERILGVLLNTTIFKGKKPPSISALINVVINSDKQFSSGKDRIQIETELRRCFEILHKKKKVEYNQETGIIKLKEKN